MVIKKVDLLDRGNRGIKVTFTGHRKINDQVAAKRDNETTEFLPLPIPLRQKFYRLKYFFLTMMGVWRDDQWTELLLDDYSGVKTLEDVMAEYDEDPAYLEKDVASRLMAADNALSNTMVDGYELDGYNIKIKGSYEVIEGKPFSPGLKFVSEDDDYNFHSEASEIMKEISTEVHEYLKQEQLQLGDVKALLQEIVKSEDEKIRIASQNEEENYVELMDKLEGQAIVFALKDSELEKQLESNNDTSEAKVQSKGTIDDKKFENIEDETIEEEDNSEKGEELDEKEENKDSSPEKEGEFF